MSCWRGVGLTAVREQSREQHVGRPAAARRDCAGARDEAGARACGRADRKSRHEIGQFGFRNDASMSTETNGTTFLVVTHNMDLARRCQRIIEVVDGKIVPPAGRR